MAKRSPRLIFTEEERALPELERAVRKADRAAVKLEKAEAKIPKKTVKVKKRVVDSESGKVTTRLFFEEADKKRPPSKLAHAARKAPLDTVRSTIHRKLREEGGDNPGTEAANTLTETAERTWRIAESAHRSHAEKPYRKADKAEAAADKANLKALNKQYAQEYLDMNAYLALRNIEREERRLRMREDWIYRRGDVYLANLDPFIGSEQGGTRPVVVLQNNTGNFYCPTLIIAPITSKGNKKRSLPTHYYAEYIHGLDVPGIVLLEQIKTIDKRRIQKYMGRMSRQQMDEIGEAIEAALGLYVPEEMEAP